MRFDYVFSLVLLYFGYFASGQRCTPTKRDVEGPFYEAGGLLTLQIAPENELRDPRQKIVLAGQVLNRNCNPIVGAFVEVWYAGGTNSRYTFPPDFLWYRGRTTTSKDSNGYLFHATYPGVYSGRPIPHIHYKVTANGREFVTQMYFPNDIPPSYESYANRFTQFPKVGDNRDGSRNVTFTIVLDM